ncbi:MAG: twin-arginine translocation signal domain-containing protein, partial [Halieaceae bacterium]
MGHSRRKGSLSRRHFIQAAAGLAASATASSRVWASGADGYSGKCLVTLQLDGGADVTQFCDPKINTPGERKINNWADWSDPGQAGNILYAPVADNEWFFNRFGADMLVVNGVDAQTNS